MLIIDEKLVSDEIFTSKFVCNLDACKGACCWEGDYGAPLEDEEIKILEEILPEVKPYLSIESLEAIEKLGVATWFEDCKEYGTSLLDNGACVFLTFEKNGMAKCGIEKAWEEGKVGFKKPISCHLYPIRVNKIKNLEFEALNYDEWDICSAACSLGESLKVPVFRFLKDALIRRYGEEFYNALEDAYQNYISPEKQ